MKDNLFYRLFAKADLTDTVKPDFSLSTLRRRKINRDAMNKIKAAEGAKLKPVHIPRRRVVIIAAALMLAVIIPISAVGISHLIWRPDVGLTDLEGNPVEADASVYTSTEAADFGSLRLSYVIWTNSSSGSTLSVWLIGDQDGSLTDLTAEGEGEIRSLTYNGSDGANGYNYVCTDFPFAETVTVSSASLGAEASFTLSERETPSIFVPEHFGISFELMPMGTAMHVVIIDRGLLGAEMSQYTWMRMIQGSGWRFYDAEGNLYVTHSGGAGLDDYGRSFMSYSLTRVSEQSDSAASVNGSEAEPVNAADIVRVEMDGMTFRYCFNDEIPAHDVPIPADGETILGDFNAFAMDGFTVSFDSIKREGDTLILHQFMTALNYTGSAPASIAESGQNILLYDESGNLLCKDVGGSTRIEGDEADPAHCSRIITVRFDVGLLDKAVSAKFSQDELWIDIDQAWSVELS